MGKMNVDAGMPIALTLEPGSYYRCTCGKSANLPFCDESHGGDEHPLRFEVLERQRVYLCSCGKTGNAPYCDGSCGVALADRT
ncbi:MAG: CDGSH iron-sulfur domain-containing protein [Desulfuromonadales bacterium]|nr:CDGSH iron-sulfur domain-containing protein [Desulfuromonadales bacterium]